MPNSTKVDKPKTVGLFGSLSNSIKASASTVEVAALGVNQLATLGLVKAQSELLDVYKESGEQNVSLDNLHNLNQRAINAARGYK